jgi:hypothetical protein
MRKHSFTAALLVFLSATGAQAGVSPRDGFSPDGDAQWHFNLTPYLWLPSTSADIALGNGAQVDIDRGAPSLSTLASTLKGAFLGAGLARYGNWSGVLDIQFVDAAQNNALPAPAPGVTRNLKEGVSYVRVAPGIGYQLYNGYMGDIPATLDGRVGFSWLQMETSLKLDQTGPAGTTRTSDLHRTGGFIQPWLGLAGAIYPAQDWRFEVEGMVDGLGVSGGSWGWGAAAILTWSANDWLNLSAGYRALNTERNDPPSAKIRSVNLTAYGPMASIGFSW